MLHTNESTFSGALDGTRLFTATRGVRVLTASSPDAANGTGPAVLGVVGISVQTVDLALSIGSGDGGRTALIKGRVEPNCEYELDRERGALRLTRRVPFFPAR